MDINWIYIKEVTAMLIYLHYTLGSHGLLAAMQEQYGDRTFSLGQVDADPSRCVLFDLSNRPDTVFNAGVDADQLTGLVNLQSFNVEKSERQLLRQRLANALDDAKNYGVKTELMLTRNDNNATVMLTSWEEPQQFERWETGPGYEPLLKYSAPGPAYFHDNFVMDED
ncbi:hypothetical protein ACLOEU_04820 [Limosilactobacillus fermentum]|uniref:hypothetical protein n=2 Tax=Limosilactobacillus fermentum TaxID=1613 RepID=UPI003EBAC932